MPNALSTQGQGATSYITMPAWGFNANAGTNGVSKIEIEFKIISFRGAAFAYLLASSGSTQNALRIDPATMRLQYRAGATNRIETGDNAIQLGQIYKARLEYNKATTRTTLYLNDVYVGEYVASNTLQFNQINRFSTTANTYVDMLLYSLSTASAANYSTYIDSWPPETAPNTGTSWTSSGGTRNLTVTSFTGATDSWWVFYSSMYIGEGTLTAAATANVELTGSKIGLANIPAVIAAALAVDDCKIGTVQLSIPLTAGIDLSAAKVGLADMPIQANADVNLYAGNVYIGTGTFSMSADANVALIGSKVGDSQVEFAAVAAAYLQGTKTGNSIAPVSVGSALALDGYKIGHATAVVLASATITFSGGRVATESSPVTVVFMRTSSKLSYNVKTSSRIIHSVKTTSRYQYHIKTFSGGDHA